MGLFLIWVVATVSVTILAWQVVLAADAQVSEPPIRLSAVPSTAPRPTITVPEETTTSLQLDPDAPATTTTTLDETQVTIPFTTETIFTDGGNVTVRYRPGEVALVAANPRLPWRAEIDNEDVDRVSVTFSLGEREIMVEARWFGDMFRYDIEPDDQ